jgi:amidohydrolase
MVDLRHTIHMHPELAYEENHTSQLIRETLASLGIQHVSGIAKTGVVGLIKGKGPGKTVLLRADMDALPIQEDLDLEYKSKINNRMHACGHDGHVAGLLGAAMILNDLRSQFNGNVKLVFQPAEEITNGGAARMIEEGVLDDPPVDAAFGCHLWGEAKEGTVQLCPGPMMAASLDFKFTIIGRGGHGALPHLALDPIIMGVQAINFMQSIISRRTDPMETAVLSIGYIRGGETENIIPDHLEAKGMIRTFNEQLSDNIKTEIENILRAITESQKGSYKFEFKQSSPSVINDRKLTELVSNSFSKIVGKDNVNAMCKPTMASEDFAFYSHKVPSVFAFVGIAKNVAEPVLHHHPKFRWDDSNLQVLAEGLAQIAMDFLNG